jgi:predicted nucleic acid-binding Zn ribbon protein
MRIAGCWEAAVGSEIAAHCQPSALRGGVLEVSVDSSVWSQHLQMRREEILDALRSELGADAPADLRFRLRL